MAQMSGRSPRVDRIYPREAFENAAAKVMNAEAGLTEGDLAVLLTYLSRDKKEVAYDDQASRSYSSLFHFVADGDLQTVKFRGPTESTPVITPQDTTIASLKTLISNLNTQIQSLTSRVNDYALSSRKAVTNQNRASALASLRSKKLAESILTERAQVLAQLEGVYTKIEQAADQVEIVRVMEASAGVLRSLNAEAGGIEKVEDVVQDLRDEMSKVDEIGSALNEVGDGGSMIDESAVDDELEALEQEERQEKEKRGADQAKRRLEEIESAKDAASRTQREPEQEAQKIKSEERPAQMSIEDSVEAMDKMSIDDADVATRERENPPKRAEQMPTAVLNG